MKQITEDYVSFETAILLKEKGFDEPCSQTYAEHPGHKDPIVMLNDASTNSKGVFGAVFPYYASAPTLQMACKWLREKHKIHPIAEPCLGEGDEENLCFDRWFWTILKEEGEYKPIRRIDEFESYELAISDAIKYCLEHLI